MANILGEPRPTFRIRRPITTTNGSGTDPDARITASLAELDRLLKKRIFGLGDEELDEAIRRAAEAEEASDEAEETSDEAEQAADDARSERSGRRRRAAQTSTGGGGGADLDAAVKAEEASAKAAEETAEKERRASKELARAVRIFQGGPGADIDAVLELPLTPRRAADDERWAPDSLAAVLDDADEADHLGTLADIIDADPELSELSAGVAAKLRNEQFRLPENARTILSGSYPGIRDYLVLLARSLDIDDVDGVVHFLTFARRGVASIADYAVIGAGREVVKQRALNVPDFDDDDSAFVKELRAAAFDGKVPLSAVSFEKAVLGVAGKELFATNERKLFDKVNVPLSDLRKEAVIRQMAAWPGGVNEANAEFVVYSLIGQSAEPAEPPDGQPTTPELTVEDFDVEFVEDDADQIQINRGDVKAAAQMYYTMVVGDELDVFGAVEFLTHRFLLRADADVSDPQLRRDLQDYVFAGQFTDLKTGRRIERTRAPERHMFIRQVFDAGEGDMAEGQLVNEAFPGLWKVLMLESARYLERAQESLNPDAYLPKGNVQQAVEDLQYNLSTHCTGMATVAMPLAYKETDFVIRRFLKHKDVLRQVSPNSGTWLRAVEQLAVMQHGGAKPNAVALYNKARLGFEIIADIAAYDPTTFDDDDVFSTFLGKVDAYITTQSILHRQPDEEGGRSELEPAPPPGGMPGMPGMAGMPGMPGPTPAHAQVPAAANGSAAHDEWDF